MRILLVLLPSLLFAQECPKLDSLVAAGKKAPKGLAERAALEASEQIHCVDSLYRVLGEKHKVWASFRKNLPDLAPEAFLRIYPIKKIKPEELKRVLWSSRIQNATTCALLHDSIGLEQIQGKGWWRQTTAWDTTDFPCKHHLMESMENLLDSVFTDPAERKAKFLALYPEIWYERYAQESTDEEKVRYATHPSLRDSTHCRFADYANAEMLMNWGHTRNACSSYIRSRFGEQILRISFRKHFKPTTLSDIRKRLSQVDTAHLASATPFLDTLEVLISDTETWEILDSLQASLLQFLQRSPNAVRTFKEPTADMLLAAFDANFDLLCAYPETNDRMITKLLVDRISDEKPLPDSATLERLQACLPPESMAVIQGILQQVQ